jgi:hypothetical protein
MHMRFVFVKKNFPKEETQFLDGAGMDSEKREGV